MGSRLKTLSGQDLVKIFSSFGFELKKQKGSHMKLKRLVYGNTETLIVQNDKTIPIGTLKSIFNQASKYISKEDLYKYFYHE
jgi:predicted RNA binding protein YcfA (HicA-like mRNA interferase family)